MSLDSNLTTFRQMSGNKENRDQRAETPQEEWKAMLDAAWANPLRTHFASAEEGKVGHIYQKDGEFLLVTAVHGSTRAPDGELHVHVTTIKATREQFEAYQRVRTAALDIPLDGLWTRDQGLRQTLLGGTDQAAPPPVLPSETRKVFTCSIHGEILSKSTTSQTTLDIERCPKKGCKGKITSHTQVIVGTKGSQLLQAPRTKEERMEPKLEKKEVKKDVKVEVKEENIEPPTASDHGELAAGPKLLAEVGFTLRKKPNTAAPLPSAGSSDVFIAVNSPNNDQQEPGGAPNEGEPVQCAMAGCEALTVHPNIFCGEHQELMIQTSGGV